MAELPPPKRDGGLAYQGGDGEWIVAYPRDMMYSTVTMSATHVSSEGAWHPIWNDDEYE